jgi:hypothetical protein
MPSLEGLKRDDPIMVPRTLDQGSMEADYERRTVQKVGKVWLTDSLGYRYWIATGQSEYHNVIHRYAMPVPEWEDREELRELNDVLKRWGLWESMPGPRATHRLDRAQLTKVVELLRSFEGGNDHE